jgi:hypothetical protein
LAEENVERSYLAGENVEKKKGKERAESDMRLIDRLLG